MLPQCENEETSNFDTIDEILGVTAEEKEDEETKGLIDNAKFQSAPVDGNMDGKKNVALLAGMSPTAALVWILQNFSTFRNELANFDSFSFLKHMRGPAEFCAVSKFENPKSSKQAISRMHANVPYFSANYMAIFVLLMIFTIITSPYLLFCSVGIFYGWAHVVKMERIDIGPLKLQGKSKIISFSVLTFLLTILLAGSSIIWVGLMTSICGSAHAVTFKGNDDMANDNVQMCLNLDDEDNDEQLTTDLISEL